jgi:hypothetical protein
VPTLARSDPCINITAPYIPRNVTRKSDFPTYQDAVPLVTLAPWVSIDCTQSYLAAGRRDGVRAAIVFQPGNSSSIPPPPGDISWSLDDGGQWKETNQYPVYAIPSVMGEIVMKELGLYSGNMTDVPYGQDLVSIYDPRDFPRLYTVISLGSGGPQLPSLWVFLIIVLGILLAVVGVTSLIMHLIQRRHRHDLQRRIARGEVNLEALGIKRLNVPQELLDKMPRYVYTSKDGEEKTAIHDDTAAPRNNLDASEVAAREALPKREVPFTQPTCSICLDDFEHNQTIVRELPCSHIFHPECIDGFLRDNSSLCPMCKKSALPQGYFVSDVTNAMVRRERLIRRMRERVESITLEDGTTITRSRSYHTSGGSRIANFQRQLGRTSRRRRAEDADVASTSAASLGSTEMAPVPATTAPDVPAIVEQPPPEVQRAGPSARREWGRNRLRSAVLQTRTANDEVRDMERALPKCRFQHNYLPTFTYRKMLT